MERSSSLESWRCNDRVTQIVPERRGSNSYLNARSPRSPRRDGVFIEGRLFVRRHGTVRRRSHRGLCPRRRVRTRGRTGEIPRDAFLRRRPPDRPRRCSERREGDRPLRRGVRPNDRPATRDPRRGRPLQDPRGRRRDDDGVGGDPRVGARDPVRRPVHGRQLRARDRGRTPHLRPHPRDAAEERGPHADDRCEGRGATPMSVLIRDVQIDRDVTQIYIEDNRIVEIGKKREADTVIDGKGKVALPGLVNLHTHAAMTLFRGWGDDLDLSTWLETKIWPAEAHLTPDDVYWGTKLACLEMIKTGTTTFNDMYFHMDAAAKAVKEMGLRAFLAEGIVDLNDPERAAKQLQTAEAVNRRIEAMKTDRITPVLGPHAIYSVSKDTLIRIRELADKTGSLIHVHLSETKREVDDCLVETGMRPAKYLDSIGFLAKDVIAAHGCWLDPSQIDLLAHTGTRVAHCPTSNMKLSVGQTMPYAALKEAAVVMGLGTDGAASNNNLDMFETMKVAALLQKYAHRDPTVLRALEAFELATLGGARALGIDAGILGADRLADLIIVDPRRPELTPRHDDVSNWVYSAHGNAVDTVICDGVVLMRGRRVRGEAESLEKATAVARDLVSRG